MAGPYCVQPAGSVNIFISHWGKQEKLLQDIAESLSGMVPDRTLPWGRLEFYSMGVSLFFLIFIKKIGMGKILERYPVVGHIYMLFSISLTWMLFAITDLTQIAVYIQRLFPFWVSCANLHIMWETI